jgi:hypothetical protein
MRCGAHELALIACSYSCVGMARIGDGAAAAMTVSCARCAGRTCRGQSAAHKGLRPSSNYKCQRAKHLRYPRTVSCAGSGPRRPSRRRPSFRPRGVFAARCRRTGRRKRSAHRGEGGLLIAAYRCSDSSATRDHVLGPALCALCSDAL